jgi:hypothetical protein
MEEKSGEHHPISRRLCRDGLVPRKDNCHRFRQKSLLLGLRQICLIKGQGKLVQSQLLGPLLVHLHLVCNPLDVLAMARALGGCKDRASVRKKKQRRRRRGTGKQ